ncbi:amino acid adenylation domain-containing protein [Kribbella sp. NPDC056345]|uniref:non-ribosomal peptide synthetase n=1 Tax=Kribbella sp. NPDC056345 TaxID=3345789 RepID=UPI0035DCD4E1
MEARLKAGLADLLAPARTGLAGRATGDRSPVSFAQRRMWFLAKLRPDDPSYLVPAVLALRGSLDEQALRTALERLGSRHEALRTTFVEERGELQQVVAADFAVPLGIRDLRALTPAERDRQWQQLGSVEAQPSFDLATGPLLRAELVRWSPTESRLLLTTHHIIVDGWSLGLLINDLVDLYAEQTQGRPASPAPEATYRDYSAWQSERADNGELAEHLDHWAQSLQGVRATELAPDRVRPEQWSWRGSRLAVRLDHQLTIAVDKQAAAWGTTRYVVLAAAFSTLLARYCGEDEVVFGSPVAGRTTTETESIVGMITNTLVLRVDLAGDPTFRSVVARTHELTLTAYAHQEAPLELVVERLAPPRDPGRHPLFQIVFALQNLPGLTSRTVGPLTVELLPMTGDAAKFDLSVLVTEVGDELNCEFEFATDLFDESTIQRFAAHYRRCLAGGLADPDLPLSQVPLLTEEERQLVTADWTGTEVEFGPDLVPDLIARQEPSSVAVRDGGRTVSYGDLSAAATAVASRLAAAGCGPGDLVAVHADRSIDLVIAEYGVLRSGAAYVPLDPAHPAERLLGMAAAAGVRAVLADESGRRLFAATDIPVLAVSGAADGEVVAHVPSATDAVYVVHTSGSTGRPKGVVVEHDGLANLVQWHLTQYGVEPGDRCTLVAAPGFDASAWEIWTALGAGAELHIPPTVVRSDPPALAKWLADQEISVCFLPTALGEAVLGAAPAGWPALRHLLLGGDALRPGAVAAGMSKVVNHYGPTENTVVATSSAVDPADPRRPAIGRPIANVRTLVLDRAGAPVPIGVPGELYLGGRSLARGYLDDEQTAAKFVQRDGARFYRTGDLVRWTADGELDFLGRADDQVKVRGQRVELAEIEAVLCAHPLIETAVVAVRGDDPVSRSLAAVLVLAEGNQLTDEDLRAALARQLPAHMVPAVLMTVDAIAVSANGKVDRAAIRWQDARALPRRTAVTRPANPAEAAVVAIWADLLGVTAVDRRDNFFELGGHSFLAVRLQEALTAEFGVEIAIPDIFQDPTPAGLAARLVRRPAGDGLRDAAQDHADRRKAGRDRQLARRRRGISDREES